jgi:hypothetical protein
LLAQEAMASSARAQVSESKHQTNAVWWGVVLSALASGIAGAGLILTATNSARQLRAHVFPSQIQLLDGALANPKLSAFVDRPGAFIVNQNTGQTPAKEVYSWAHVRVLPVRDEHLLILPVLEKKSPSYVPAGGSMTKTVNSDAKMTRQEKNGVINGTHAVFVYGSISYRDVFGRKQSSTFRLKYNGAYPPKGSPNLWFCDDGNSAS